MKRTGVFICHCGINIAGTVDVKKAAKDLSKHPGVAHSEEYVYMCSDPGQNLMIDAIKEKKLDNVVVACCSPTLHETTFRNASKSAGINTFQCEIANIREQSRVGKVSESWIIWPPMEGDLSTRMTSKPLLAMSRADWMPEIPPPITSALRVTGMLIGSNDSFLRTLSTALFVSLIALSVALSMSLWTQLHCSRMLAISHWKVFIPADLAVFRNVVSWRVGEQQDTTTLSSFFSFMASIIRF